MEDKGPDLLAFLQSGQRPDARDPGFDSGPRVARGAVAGAVGNVERFVRRRRAPRSVLLREAPAGRKLGEAVRAFRGHGGIGAGRAQNVALGADEYAFRLWQFVVPEYQPAI